MSSEKHALGESFLCFTQLCRPHVLTGATNQPLIPYRQPTFTPAPPGLVGDQRERDGESKLHLKIGRHCSFRCKDDERTEKPVYTAKFRKSDSLNYPELLIHRIKAKVGIYKTTPTGATEGGAKEGGASEGCPVEDDPSEGAPEAGSAEGGTAEGCPAKGGL